MQQLFTTDHVEEQNRFNAWLDFCDARLARMKQTTIGDGPFEAHLSGTGLGPLLITRSRYSPMHLEATASSIRNTFSKPDAFFFNIKLAGEVRFAQGDRADVQGAGDTSLYDTNKPLQIYHPGPVDQLIIQMPRDRLEDMLGSSRHYTGLTIRGDLPTTVMVKSFFNGLMRVQDRLAPEATERMASIGMDLIVASIAERMALDTPKPLQGTVTVQRAKAFIEANLGSVELDPSLVAAAVGVSLRHLHGLFRDHGRTVSAWIWQRRLEGAAARLTDPASLQLPLSTIAYTCGFADPAHFSRRFRDRYGMSPSEYRHWSITQRP